MKIGFVGLGNMGAPMAANLVKAGYALRVFDLSGAELAGAISAGSAAEAASGADVVVTMLPDGAALRAVADEILPEMQAGSLLLDCSTVDVATARGVAQKATDSDVAMLDAPVSGGTAGAAAGSLTFMVGGPDAAVKIAGPLLEEMGSRLVHCGGAGTGQAAKICNNMILGATMAVTCEAFVLADGLGLDRQALFDVVSTSSGQSWSCTTYCPAPGIGPVSPADRGYAPGFATALMLKDLHLGQMAAQQAGCDTPMGARATEVYDAFSADGGRDRDFSGLLEWLGARTRANAP